MNKLHGVAIFLLLLAGDFGIPRYSEACSTVSSIQCVNTTYFMWCVDTGDGTLVTIGNAEVCPGTLVCDDSQTAGCVSSDTVQITTELISDPTTETSTDAIVTTIAPVDLTTSETSGTISDADFECIYEGLYAAQDCSRFHVCYKIIWFIQHYMARCSQGLYWSSNEKRCVLQALSDCA